MESPKKAVRSRCPYCVSGSGFTEMNVLEKRHQICESCGHLVIPGDSALWCPRLKCLEVHFLRIHRGLTGDDEPAPLAEVFGDDG
jgi:uncharacterized protein (DUF983 family)